MEIKLYNTKSPNNKIGKVLENETVFECRFKKDNTCDILKPVIIIQSENFLSFNYAYIEQFNRYYFVNDIVVFPNNIFMLSLDVDVLESWKNDIMNSTCKIEHSTELNNYYDNDNYKNLETYENEHFEKDVEVKNTNVIVLVTMG